MSLSCGSGTEAVQPMTPRVHVTELTGSGYMNPTPSSNPNEHSQKDEQLHLSPERLELLCGTPDLSLVTSLEVCVNTKEYTLDNFGAYLPRLMKLKVNNSFISSVRDLGTSLSHLQVLWMSHCCLQDLDGISTLFSLKELYVAFNSVSDLSQLGMLENLQVLDLEENHVDDLIQVQYLGLCHELQMLTLEGNPVCACSNPSSRQVEGYNYRAAVRELVPQLRYLDNVKLEVERVPCRVAKSRSPPVCSTHIAPIRHSTSSPGVQPLSSCRPATGPAGISSTACRPGSSEFDLTAVEAATSSLTHGAGTILFCGNPARTIRARREKLKTAPSRSALATHDVPIHVPEHTYDPDDPKELADVLAELRTWREQHAKRLELIQKEKAPQILTVHHSDDEEKCDHEQKGFDCMRMESRDEDQREKEHCDHVGTGPPDSLCPSLSPEPNQEEALFPDLSRLSVFPDSTLSPSPPPCPVTDTTNRKVSVTRGNRLRVRQILLDSPGLTARSQAPKPHSTKEELVSETIQELTKMSGPARPPCFHIPHPPPARASKGARDPCSEALNVTQTLKPSMRKMSERAAISRPHTARAALQKHQQHQAL